MSFANAKALRVAMLADLARSGLDTNDARKLHCQPLLPGQLNGTLPSAARAAGYLIPYFSIGGEPIEFARYRYLEPVLDFKGKPRRYTQPGGAPPQIYFPPFAPWPEITTHPTVDMFTTEGEKKAACATKFGFATIGLGGVWNFRSAKEGQLLIPQFAEITWAERRIIIVYDSDTIHKPGVMQAENALAAELTKLGARVHILRLPEDGPAKVGLDDYLVAHGAEAFKTLLASPALSEWRCSAELHRLSEEVIYIMSPATILRLSDMQRMPRSTFLDAYAPRQFDEIVQVSTTTGKVKTKGVHRDPAQEWIAWPHRPTLERICYRPGCDDICPGPDGRLELNSWPGWAVEPAPGDASPFLELLEYLTSLEPHFLNNALQWFAYPVQHPGTKLYTALVVWSIGQGIGKSLLGETMEGIYGRNYGVIDNDDLGSKFNAWAVRKQFVLGNEVAGRDSKELMFKVRDMVTRITMKIENKGVDPYWITDCINYYVSSNSARPVYAQDDERRFLVVRAPQERLPPGFYDRYKDWLWLDKNAHRFRPESMSALMWELLHTDLSGFDPTAAAPVTDAMLEMIDNSRSPLDDITHNLLVDPNLELDGELHRQRCLFILGELGTAIRNKHPELRSITDTALRVALAEAGVPRLNNGKAIRYSKDSTARLYAVRERDRWLQATVAEIGRRYAEEREMVPGKWQYHTN
jgi:hypothetical protein